MRRLDLSFMSEGERCDAWLHLPDGPGPHPCIVVAHGIGAIRQVRMSAYAEKFVEAGFALLAFDYRHWGTSSGLPRHLCSVRKQHRDIEAAIDFAQAHPAIAPAEVILFGTSFGGGHALEVASRRPDLAAVVSQCTVADCLAVALRTPIRQMLQWVFAGMADQAKALLGLPPRYIKLAGEPGELAVMTKLGAEQRYEQMIDGPSPWRNLVAARFLLTLPLYRPIRRACAIESPVLMIVCDKDEICPGRIAARAAELAPRGRAIHFDSSHFDIYFGELFQAATRAITEFLRETLPAGPSRGQASAAPVNANQAA